MQKDQAVLEFALVTPTAKISAPAHGWRAKCLQRLIRLDLPVPATVALPAQTVRAIAAGHMVDIAAAICRISGPIR